MPSAEINEVFPLLAVTTNSPDEDSTSSISNVTAPDVSSSIVWSDTEVIVAASLTGVIVISNVSLTVVVPSSTASVIVAVPD